MDSLPGSLGSYPVERELGRGGMGVVYLARDPRLNRPVAIKVLSPVFARNSEYLSRFEREAKLLASLTHQNIASIYSVEETAGGEWLLLLEYVAGETLAERLARGALPIEEALDCCRQIALALEAAHEAGIIHRDLKPGNVKIAPDGQVKVLDFGLAKGRNATPSDVDLALSPTYVDVPTGVGVILGTAGYMSPEQARGKAVDRRTDIWSFGCVLYECLTGVRTFAGETTSDTIARILERDPDWSALPPQTPARLRDLLRRCLEKDPRKRQRDIGDVRMEIEDALASRAWLGAPAVVPASPGAAKRTLRRVAAVVLMVAAGAAVGGASWARFGPSAARPATGGAVRLAVPIPATVRATSVVSTPDGNTLLVWGFPRAADGTEEREPHLYARRLSDEDLRPIPGTKGIQAWTLSPDSRWIAFVVQASDDTSQRQLMKAAVDGGSPPVTLADWNDTWDSPVWLERGDLLIAGQRGGRPQYVTVSASGGTPSAPATIDTGGLQGFAGFTIALPGDRGVFFELASWGPRGYQNDVWVLDLRTGKASRVLENAGNPIYAPTGHLVFARGEALMAAPFDLERLSITGEVTALSGGLRVSSWGNGDFTLSRSGVLTYTAGGRLGLSRQLVIVDAAGKVTPFVAERRPFDSGPAVTADGQRAVAVIPNARGTFELWLATLNRPGLQRFIALPNADASAAVWSPDGRRVAFSRIALDADDGIYLQQSDGSAPPVLLAKTTAPHRFMIPTSWKSDGTALLAMVTVDSKSDVVYVPITREGTAGTPRPLRATPYDESSAEFSPDGTLVSLMSDESGKYEIYVAPLTADGTLGPPLMVSNGACSRAQWTADSKRVFYCQAGAVMAVTVNRNPQLSVSPAVRTYDLRKLRVGNADWTVLADGRLLATQKGEDEGPDAPRTFAVVLNWFDELERRMNRR